MTSSKYGRKRKLRIIPCFLAGIIVFTIVFFSSFICAKNAAATNVFEERPMIRVIVASGDTLWELAKEYRPNYNGDIRALIYEIKKINNYKTAEIMPGEIIYIPLN